MRFARQMTLSLSIAGLLLSSVAHGAEKKAAAKDEAPHVNARQLAEAYLKNANAAEKQYGGHYALKEIVVEGTVTELKDGEYGKTARLEGAKGVVITILLHKDDEESVKKGDTITVRGRCRGFYEKEKLIDINGGRLEKKGK